MEKNTLPTVFVILGATGDLMRQKLIPALFHLYKEKSLPELFQVIGFSKDDLDKDGFRHMVREMTQAKVQATQEEIDSFSKFFVYEQGTFEKEEGYQKLAEFLGYKDKEWKVCSNKLFYLAVPPQHYKTIFENLASSGLTKPCSKEEGWTRVIVEKPFGKDLQTAQELDRMLGALFYEEQIYRMDHYLGKETVQNILAFRFSNSFLQDSWNKKGVEQITIRLLEKEGVGERGAFYDGLGALRDVGQNHLLQLLSLFCMETPLKFDGDSLRRERAKVLKALPTISTDDIKTYAKRGQYEGYGEEKNVVQSSNTETYFSIQTSLKNDTWEGVPILLESGKGMKENLVEVEVVFRHPTPCLCPSEANKHYHNVLHYFIQPKEGIAMSLWVKKPGPIMTIEEKAFTFDYKSAFGKEEFADPYERLLLNCIQGDQTLFVSTEEIMASWKFVDSILRGWGKTKAPLVVYPKGASAIETKLSLAVDN
ncbi:MAG: glucose-6-phosphate dehydrogenase [bacterium]|nr:glucose-6-phosphate dehydrogenase [bacterium]